MRHCQDSYLFPGAFAPILSLDEVAASLDEETGAGPYDLTDPAPLAVEQLERDEARRAVCSFLASLTPRDQEIIRRVFWDEESQTAVAGRLKVSKMAISKAMARIFKHARVALTAHEHLALTN
jgi:RNA polymerase sigma factor (sigma-70 family)